MPADLGVHSLWVEEKKKKTDAQRLGWGWNLCFKSLSCPGVDAKS